MQTNVEPTHITATELARSLSDVLNRVRYRGERFVVERNGEPVAFIDPATARKGRTGRELAKLIGHLQIPEGFADDLEAIHAAQGLPQIREWPS